MKGNKQLIEELSDEEFDDDFQFSDEDDAPVTLKKSDQEKLHSSRSKKETKTKKIKKSKKQNKVEIRGSDIFNQELPQETIQDLKQKQQTVMEQQEKEEQLERKQRQLQKRNQKVNKQQLNNSKHIIYVHKQTKKQYMVSNRITQEAIDPMSVEVHSFMQNQWNKHKRVPLNSIL